jgi:hypothetical protein
MNSQYHKLRRNLVKYLSWNWFARLSICTVSLFVWCATSRHSLAQSQSLDTPWKQQSFSLTFSKARTFSVISRGFLVTFERLSDTGGSNAINLTALHDGSVKKEVFSMGPTSHTWLSDVGVASDGSLLITGFFRSDDQQSQTFWAHVRDGKNLQLVSTGSYAPERICSTDNGEIWPLGQDWTSEESGTDYPLLKRYSQDGIFKSGSLFKSKLSNVYGYENLTSRTHGNEQSHGRMRLLCSGNSVYAYIGALQLFFHTATDKKSKLKWQMAPPLPESTITGLAVTPQGKVYASFNGRICATTDGGAQPCVVTSALYALNISFRKAVWNPIANSAGPSNQQGSVAVLMGTDGSSLVYLRRNMVASG